MDDGLLVVESKDQEMCGRRYQSQTEISAVRAYICMTKNKPQNLKFWDHMNQEA